MNVAVALPMLNGLASPIEIPRPPVLVCCVGVASDASSLVDGAAHAVAPPKQSATMGAPAHTLTNLTDVLIGIPTFLGAHQRTHTVVYGRGRQLVQSPVVSVD